MENHTTTIVAASQTASSPRFLTLNELAERWGITVGGVNWRLNKRGIAIDQDASGAKGVYESDIEGVDWAKREYVRRESVPEAKKPFAFPDPVAVGEAMSVARRAAEPGDSDRVRRLLKAMSSIREILTDIDDAPGFAAWAVADYAIGAESNDGS